MRLILAVLAAFWSLPALAQTNLGNPAVGFGHFQPNFGGTQAISGTTTSASVTLTAQEASQNTELRLFNSGAVVVFCRWGIGAQTAVTGTDVPIAPGATQFFTKGVIQVGQGQTQVVACLTLSGTSTVYVTTGIGGTGTQ
jgi:hypothetical protein